MITLAARYRQVRHRRGEMACLRSLGGLHFRMHNMEASKTCLIDALNIAEVSHHTINGTTRVNKQEKAFILRALGEVQVAQGDFEEGLANLERSIPIFREVNRNFAAKDTLDLLGKQKGNKGKQQRTRDRDEKSRTNFNSQSGTSGGGKNSGKVNSSLDKYTAVGRSGWQAMAEVFSFKRKNSGSSRSGSTAHVNVSSSGSNSTRPKPDSTYTNF